MEDNKIKNQKIILFYIFLCFIFFGKMNPLVRIVNGLRIKDERNSFRKRIRGRLGRIFK